MMGIKQCAADLKFMDFLAIMTHIDTVITLVVPSITIIVLNTLIGCFIYKASKEFSDSNSSLRFQSGETRFHTVQTLWLLPSQSSVSEEESSKDKTPASHEKPIRESINVKIRAERVGTLGKSAQRKTHQVDQNASHNIICILIDEFTSSCQSYPTSCVANDAV